MKALLLGTAAAMLAAMAAPAWAEQIPTSGPRDPRVRTVVYDPMNVVDITGVIRAATEVEFAPTETIEKVAGGDATSWLVAPAGNLMFLKPTQALPPSNLVVVTRRPDGSQRSYVFELTVRDGDMTRNTPQTYFKVVFRYPADEAAAKQAELARTAQAAAKRDANSRLDVDFFYGVRNWAYTAQGDAALQPTEVSDNGQVTVFRFPGNMEVPVIYEIKADGTESIVPRTVRGDQVIVDAIARQFRIRAGSQVLCIFNRRFDPIGQHQGTGTVSPDVSRQVKEPAPWYDPRGSDRRAASRRAQCLGCRRPAWCVLHRRPRRRRDRHGRRRAGGIGVHPAPAKGAHRAAAGLPGAAARCL